MQVCFEWAVCVFVVSTLQAVCVFCIFVVCTHRLYGYTGVVGADPLERTGIGGTESGRRNEGKFHSASDTNRKYKCILTIYGL